MVAITEFSRRMLDLRAGQRVACAVMAACIVFTGMSLGAYGASSVAHPGYSITITQIQ